MKRHRKVYLEDWIWKTARESSMNISKEISKLLINLTLKKKRLILAFEHCYLCKNHYNKEDLFKIEPFIDYTFTSYTAFACKSCLNKYKFVESTFGNKKVHSWEGKQSDNIEKNIMEAYKKEFRGVTALKLTPYSLGAISRFNPLNSDSFQSIKCSGEWLYQLLSNNNTLIASEKGLLKYKTTDFYNIEVSKADPLNSEVGGSLTN